MYVSYAPVNEQRSRGLQKMQWMDDILQDLIKLRLLPGHARNRDGGSVWLTPQQRNRQFETEEEVNMCCTV